MLQNSSELAKPHRYMTKIPLPLLLLLLLSPVVAGAQFQPAPSPGTLPDGRISHETLIRGGVEESRWNFGGVRVDPWIGIREAGFVGNVFGRYESEEGADVEIEDDFRVIAGAGLRAYLPFGR